MPRPNIRVSIDCAVGCLDDERVTEALDALQRAAMDAADEVLRVAGEGGVLFSLQAESFELEPASDEEAALVDEAMRRHG